MPPLAIPRVPPPHEAFGQGLREQIADTLETLGRLDVDDGHALARVLDRTDTLLARLEREIAISQGGTLALLRVQVEMLRRAKPSRRRPIAMQLYRHLAVFTAFCLKHGRVEGDNGGAARRVVEEAPLLARALRTPLQPWLALI